VAGRPSLRIGQHGKITRKYLGGGIWLAQCRFRDTDGVTRRVQRLGPPDEHDKYGKLAADALIETLADRRPPSGAGSITLETLVMSLVGQHIERLTEDGRSPRTLDTYRYTATKLSKFMAGVKVGEASAARLDAALRSMRTAHGATMARQARTLLRGALQLAVLNNVLGANPVRDVQSIKSKEQPKGAQALTADQLRDLLAKLRTSEKCRQRDLTDPITLLIATGLRRSELLALRWSDFDADAETISICGKVIREKAKGLIRVPRSPSPRSPSVGTCRTSASRRSSSRPPAGRFATLTTSRGNGVGPATSWGSRTSARTASARRWQRSSTTPACRRASVPTI
jgi:integrase